MVDTKPTNKIAAIRAIRCLPFKIMDRTSENGVVHKSIEIDLSLLDAKTLVESIMSIEASNYSINDMKNEIEILKKKIKIWETNYYNLRNKIYEALHDDPTYGDSSEETKSNNPEF